MSSSNSVNSIYQAKKILEKFNDIASDARYKDDISDAVDLVYKKEYKMVFDSTSKRLNFHCIKCCKSMNNTQSLEAHNISDKHKKMLGFCAEKVIQPRLSEEDVDVRALLSRGDILGVHLIEEYVPSNGGDPYYKCLLCGVHGKGSSVVRHMIADKHTDKYIRKRVVGDVDILGDKRERIRGIIKDKEENFECFGIEGIKSYHRDELFPFKWEDSGRTESYLLAKFRKRPASPVPPLTRANGLSPLEHSVHSTANGADSAYVHDAAQQVYMAEVHLNTVRTVLAQISESGHPISSAEAASLALRIMFSMTCVMREILQAVRERHLPNINETAVRKMFEILSTTNRNLALVLAPSLENRYPNLPPLELTVSKWRKLSQS